MLFFYCNTDAQLHMLQQELAAVTERESTAQIAFVQANKRPLKQTKKKPQTKRTSICTLTLRYPESVSKSASGVTVSKQDCKSLHLAGDFWEARLPRKS